MFMTNKVFLDSSVLVEYAKKTRMELLRDLMSIQTLELFINETVVSEYTFYHLIIEGAKAPRTLKENKVIPTIIKTANPITFLRLFSYLSTNESILALYLDFMEKYNLLPNDALILATCKLHGINHLASFDASDFTIACAGEGIQLIQSINDLT